MLYSTHILAVNAYSPSTHSFSLSFTSCLTLPGGDQLSNRQGAEVQSGHNQLPPVAGRPAGVGAELRQQGGSRSLRQRHDACPGGAECTH